MQEEIKSIEIDIRPSIELNKKDPLWYEHTQERLLRAELNRLDKIIDAYTKILKSPKATIQHAFILDYYNRVYERTRKELDNIVSKVN